MSVGILGTLLAEEPPARGRPPQTIAEAVYKPFVELIGRLGLRAALLMLAFAATYKFGEQFAGVLTGTFYRSVGFTKTELAIANKVIGFLATLVGGMLGAVAVQRYGVRKMLVLFGIGQATTHVAYMLIAIVGKNIPVFCVALFIENASAATATAAFVAALMAVCNPSVSATQYALLTSLTSVGGAVFGSFAGEVAEGVGWQTFFLITIAMAIPGIILTRFATPATRDAAPG
jgi:PAT family beta-lactamase induction signal transducer AmpG